MNLVEFLRLAFVDMLRNALTVIGGSSFVDSLSAGRCHK